MEKFPIHLQIQLNHEDVGVIRKYVKEIKEPNCYLEIGTHNGGSALIARTATDQPIYTIDNIDICQIPLKELDINFINNNSEDSAKDWGIPIEVLFIDGDHTRAYQDFLDWEKYVIKGGYILFHDYIDESGFITVKKDCEPIIKDERYEKLFVPDFCGSGTRILQVKKL